MSGRGNAWDGSHGRDNGADGSSGRGNGADRSTGRGPQAPPGERQQLPDSRLRALFALLAAQRARAAAAALAIVVTTAAGLAPPYLAGRVVDAIATRRPPSEALLLAAAFLAAGLVVLVANRAQTLLVGAVGQALLRDLRVRAFDHLLRLPLAYHQRVPSGVSMSRLTNDVQALDQLVSDGFTTLLGSALTLAGLAVVLVLLDPELALVAFAFAPPMLLFGFWYRSTAQRAFRATRRRVAELTAYLQETLAAVRVIRAFAQEQRHVADAHRLGERNFDANMRTVQLNAAYFPVVELVSGLATVAVLLVGGRRVLSGETSLGTLASFVFYLQSFFDPIQQLSQLHTTYQAGAAGLDRILDLLRTRPTLAEPRNPRRLGRARGELRLDEVTFSYSGGGESRPAVCGVDLALAPGRTVALVGPTGAGKSTVARLACRLFDPDRGRVTLDGIDLRELAQRELRRHVVLVPQEQFLFPGTVGENIALGRPDATRREIERAARLVGVHEAIAALPDGYDTDVGEAGQRLSSGERQLVALARAALVEPVVLILDEASSGLDAATERRVQSALRVLAAGRATLVIAHRLSGVTEADEIAVLDRGRIVERGSHEQLLRAGGRYAELWSAWSGAQPSDGTPAAPGAATL